MKTGFLLLLFLFPLLSFARQAQQDTVLARQGADTVFPRKDTMVPTKDSIAAASVSVIDVPAKERPAYQSMIERALQQSRYINTVSPPAVSVSREMPALFQDVLFYILMGLLMFFAFLRFLFERYFNNMFRVFFNTSLRQSQLTDQLLQAKQVSLFYNVLFVFTGGLYVYFLMVHFNWVGRQDPVMMISSCVVFLALLYFSKYLSLRFTGWITGYDAAAGTYLFVIFLINKILGVLLIPFVIVIAFGREFLHYPAILISLIIIGIMFLLRFFRSYGLLRKDIRVSRFHFLIYILGVEVLPLLLIYKTLVVLFGKNA